MCIRDRDYPELKEAFEKETSESAEVIGKYLRQLKSEPTCSIESAQALSLIHIQSEKVSITIENSSEFKAGDIGKYLTGFEVLNPELAICHLDSKATMQIDITINKGRGYVPADENREYQMCIRDSFVN